MADGRKRKDGKKKLFPPAVNRARVNYHSSGERDAQKRNARAVARKRTKGNGDGMEREDGRGGWYPADLVNSEPEASNLTSIRHTYEKAFRLVVRLDLCQLRHEAAATNFMRVPVKEMEVESSWRERKRWREKKRKEMREMRLSIFTSSLNYENFVSAQNLFLGVRALPLQDSSMVLGKCRGISLAPRLSTRIWRLLYIRNYDNSRSDYEMTRKFVTNLGH